MVEGCCIKITVQNCGAYSFEVFSRDLPASTSSYAVQSSCYLGGELKPKWSSQLPRTARSRAIGGYSPSPAQPALRRSNAAFGRGRSAAELPDCCDRRDSLFKISLMPVDTSIEHRDHNCTR
jgi:hypothetical protein